MDVRRDIVSKPDNMDKTVLRALGHWPLVLEVPGSIPATNRAHKLLFVSICRDDMNKVHHPNSFVKWRPPVQGQYPLCMLKNPTLVI